MDFIATAVAHFKCYRLRTSTDWKKIENKTQNKHYLGQDMSLVCTLQKKM